MAFLLVGWTLISIFLTWKAQVGFLPTLEHAQLFLESALEVFSRLRLRFEIEEVNSCSLLDEDDAISRSSSRTYRSSTSAKSSSRSSRKERVCKKCRVFFLKTVEVSNYVNLV